VPCEYTGRYRYRHKKTFFQNILLVLQIEISCRDLDPLKGYFDTFVFWRDASPEDIKANIEWTEYIPPDVTS
jgi:hypothetical protein